MRIAADHDDLVARSIADGCAYVSVGDAGHHPGRHEARGGVRSLVVEMVIADSEPVEECCSRVRSVPSGFDPHCGRHDCGYDVAASSTSRDGFEVSENPPVLGMGHCRQRLYEDDDDLYA